MRNTFILATLLLFAAACNPKTPQATQPVERRPFPVAALGRFHQAIGHIEMNQYQQAADLLKPLAAETGDEPAVLGNLAIALLGLQQYDAAAEAVGRARGESGVQAGLAVIQGQVLEAKNDRAEALRVLREAVRQNPSDAAARWAFSVALQNQNDPALQREVAESCKELTRLAPRNVAALLEAAKAYARAGESAEAWAYIDRVAALLGDAPEEVRNLLATARPAGTTSAPSAQATVSTAVRLFNLLLATDRFKADRIMLGSASADPTWMVIRHPIRPLAGKSSEAIQAQARFEPATEALGLGDVAKDVQVRNIVWGTVTDDRAPALYILREKDHGQLLVRKDGKLIDITREAGLASAHISRAALFMDVNNDRRMDLVLCGAAQDAIFINKEDGKFADETAVRLGEGSKSVGAAPFDYDNDGDLDLIMWGESRWRIHRNDGEGNFKRLDAVKGLAGDVAFITSVQPLDLDDDGDIDLVVTASDTKNPLRIYSNERLASFREVTSEIPAGRFLRAQNVLIEDLDNDGWFELLNPTTGEWIEIGVDFKVISEGVRGGATSAPAPSTPVTRYGAIALDIDRDGRLEVIRCDEHGKTDCEGVTVQRGSRLLAVDLDGDGAVDLLSTRGEAFVNRTEDAGHWLGVSLAAVIKGDSRFNAFGIGSTIEIRAGDLYQKRVVNGPTTWFGLGPYRDVDVLRIVWPNGSYQNLSYKAFDAMKLAGDRVIVQEQSLKGSCPYLYAWNGREFAFVTDVLWRSALGMSIMSEVFGHHGTADEYFKIDGERLAPRDGKYVLQFTEELWETAYFDYCRLFVVDHPTGTEVYVNEKCMAPPYPPFRIYPVREARIPRATDERGRDLTELLTKADHRYVADFTPTRYQGLVNDHDLIFDLGAFEGDPEVLVYLHGWLMPTDASVNVAVSQTATLAARPPAVFVPGADGNWIEAVPSMGFPSGKNKTVIVDLTRKFPTDDHRVKISTNFSIYWDRAFFTVGPQNVDMRVTELPVAAADLHYRGSSHEYRRVPGGPMEPEYAAIDPERVWRDLVGWCTEYGDITALLLKPEGQYAIVNSGDEVTLVFDAALAPPLAAGWTRDYVIHTDGWLKDGDLNSATGKTVGPLPFHGMSAFPYPADERPPTTPEFEAYLKKYNTRWVDQSAFQERIRNETPKRQNAETPK